MATDSDRPVEAGAHAPARDGAPDRAASPTGGRWTYLRRQWLIPLLPIVLALVVATLVVWLAG